LKFLELEKPIYIACDHGGFELKNKLIKKFNELQFEDLGCHNKDSIDYPDLAHSLINKITGNEIEENPKTMGVLICGSGQGMAMTANKDKNIRAALCWSEESAVLSRSHNNAQVLCVGARLLTEAIVFDIVKAFFSTSFDGGRHLKRINKI